MTNVAEALALLYAGKTKNLPRPERLRTFKGTRQRIRGVLSLDRNVHILYELVETGERRVIAASSWLTPHAADPPDCLTAKINPSPGTHWQRVSDGATCRICCIAYAHFGGQPQVVYILDAPAGIVEMCPLLDWQPQGSHPPAYVLVP